MLFLNNLNSILQNVSSEEFLFLGGDFNCTEQNLDRNQIEPHEPSRKRIIQVIKTHELSDIFFNGSLMVIKGSILGLTLVTMFCPWRD